MVFSLREWGKASWHEVKWFTWMAVHHAMIHQAVVQYHAEQCQPSDGGTDCTDLPYPRSF